MTIRNGPLTDSLKAFQRQIEGAIAIIPAKAGAMIVQHANEAFRNQGFTDVGLQPWTPSKSNKDEGREVLVKSGRLRRSIRVVNTTPDSVTVGTDAP